jgi:hypothetical protein
MSKKKQLNQFLIDTLGIDYTDDNFIRWIYLNGIKTKYMVTINGEVISIRKQTKKILMHWLDKDGYHHVIIYIDGKPHYCAVHRLVASAFIPNPENKEQVNHKDGNIDNNCVSNLEWNTAKENIHHAWKTGLSSAKDGEDHPNSEYTNEQIQKVCKYLEENLKTMREISNLTNVSYTVVKQIRNHIIWNNISKNYDIDRYSVSARKCKIKYTKEQIHLVCEMLQAGNKTYAEISEKTGVSSESIGLIYAGKSWKTIACNYEFKKHERK